ncbi:antitoxin VapB family protein [Halorussus marinus]|nr:antitoxin VapB family protein [Halorussus marinus]
MADDVTSIQVRNETWQELNARKAPGDTFDDVIQRLLDQADE